MKITEAEARRRVSMYDSFKDSDKNELLSPLVVLKKVLIVVCFLMFILMFVNVTHIETETTMKCSSGEIGINIEDLSNFTKNSSLNGIKDMNCDITVKYAGNAMILYDLIK